MRFSVGYELTEPVRAAILEIPEDAWVPAVDQDGQARANGQVTEITASLDLSCWPEGSRLIVRRERPHPGRSCASPTMMGTASRRSSPTRTTRTSRPLECRHRQHAHVEDRIRDDKDTGPGQVPVQRVRAERGVAGDRDARARPDRLDPSAAARRRARQSRAQAAALPAPARRRTPRVLRPARQAPPTRTWPWATSLIEAFTKLKTLPAPAG